MSALVGWSATAALAAYAQRRPGVPVIGWLVASLGLTVGLSAAVIGALFDFNGVTFRLLHIGISLLGPLYMAWGALEYGVRSAQGRFASRLFLSAFTIVPLVILSMDRISGRFSTGFPALGDHYDLIPRSIVNVSQVVIAVFLVTAVVAVARRSGTDRNHRLAVVGLVALAALLSITVGRLGLGAVGPLLMLGAVAALWGAAALMVRPRRDRYDEDDDYYDDDYEDDADRDPEDELLEEPVRRKRRNADPYDDYYDGPPVRQSPPAKLRGVITIYTLGDGQGPGFDRIADAVVAEVASREPDTLLFACHTVPSAPSQRIVYAIYRDDLAKEEHEQQPHVMEFGRRTGSHVVATNVIELSLAGAAASDGLASLLMPR